MTSSRSTNSMAFMKIMTQRILALRVYPIHLIMTQCNKGTNQTRNSFFQDTFHRHLTMIGILSSGECRMESAFV